jgi:hypothetical protein
MEYIPQPNNSAIFTAFNDALFAEIWRETSKHSSNAAKHSTAGSVYATDLIF